MILEHTTEYQIISEKDLSAYTLLAVRSQFYFTLTLGYLDNHSRGVCSIKVATDKMSKWYNLNEQRKHLGYSSELPLYGDITHKYTSKFKRWSE